MSNADNDPRNVAAKYRVYRADNGEIELRSIKKSFHNLTAKQSGAHLRIMATPQTAHWNLSDKKNSFDAVRLRVEDLAIGFRGDEGWSSPLIENCFFVIDGEDIRYVPLTDLCIITYEQFRLSEIHIAQAKGESVITQKKSDKSEDCPLAIARLVHCSQDTEILDTLECTIGLDAENFQKLLDACINKRISKVHLHGIGRALSVGLKYGVPRELILLANEGMDIKIDRITFDYLV